MNGGEVKPESNKHVIFLVVLTLAIAAIIGIGTFAYCMIFNVKPDGVITTAFAGIVGSCIGYLAGILSKTSPTEATKQHLGSPAPVTVVNPPSDPVPVEPRP